VKIVLELPDDWSESQALILADRLETRELPEGVTVRVLGSDDRELMDDD
jgi:hypothetical protein